MQKTLVLTLLIYWVLVFKLDLKAQMAEQNQFILTHNDSTALEKVIVERYYECDSADCADTNSGILQNGSVTYRVYIDLREGYQIQSVFGSPTHELFIKTNTRFYNNLDAMAYTGFNVDAKNINNGNTVLDSWITLGAANKIHTGILLSDDKDGSLIKNKPKLKAADGFTTGVFPNFKIYNIDLSCFNSKNAWEFSTNNGAWVAFGGVKGPNADNIILVAQITTNGKLSFQLNIQVGTPTKGVIQFVAKNAVNNEILFEGLNYKQ